MVPNSDCRKIEFFFGSRRGLSPLSDKDVDTSNRLNPPKTQWDSLVFAARNPQGSSDEQESFRLGAVRATAVECSCLGEVFVVGFVRRLWLLHQPTNQII